MTTEPKNEDAVCAAVIDAVQRETGDTLTVTDRPDRTERTEQAVEMRLTATPSGRQYAIEHTRIQSFAKQIHDNQRFADLLDPLELDLAGRVAGHFWLIVRIGATTNVPYARFPRIREAIKGWIVDTAPTLDSE